MRTLGSTATGTGKELYPSDIMDIGFKLWQKSLNQFSLLDVSHMEGNFLVCLIALLVLLMTAWVVKNIVELVCAAWVVLYAGAIFLAFGAAPFFRDIAISYYRTMLAIGAALMTMEMIIGIGAQFLQSLVAMMGDMANPQEMTVIMVAAFILAGISHRLPNMVAGIIGGSHGVGHAGLMTALAFGAAAGKVVAGAAAQGAAAQSAAAKKAQPTLDAIRNGQRAAAASDQASNAVREGATGDGQGTVAANAGGNGNGSTSSNPYLPGGR
jgi:P-type conjugative transfer protein TrbL